MVEITWVRVNYKFMFIMVEETRVPRIVSMLNFCGIVAAILKIEIGRNFSMSGINSGHHNLPTYEISLKSNNVEFVRY
jgi:hypothetical protein